MTEIITENILGILSGIEETENVTVLYACESGSRAWGFESQDSDYDVRFIYLCRTPHYLSMDRGKGVIERPIENGFDVSGWDLIKALELLRKSNQPAKEYGGLISHKDSYWRKEVFNETTSQCAFVDRTHWHAHYWNKLL